MLVTYILDGLAALSFALLLWQWLAGARFPLHKRPAHTGFAPAVTLLKPLKGCDAETLACLESWVAQQYSGPVQILFGVASPDDPVCEVIRQLMARHPNADAQLVICSENLGPNAKVSSLVQLERLAKHEVILISDADVFAPPDFLTHAVQPLENVAVGLVNCFYQFANPSTLAMRWEAVAVNADFWSQVLQSQMLRPLDFALGAAMVTRRAQLEAIGGFLALADCLADDYQLGHRIAKTGKDVVLCTLVVECRESPKGWAQIWRHQLRWARTIRVCQPAPFFFSTLSNATLWPVLWSAWMWGSGLELRFAVIPLLLMLPARTFIALQLAEKLTGKTDHYTSFWLVPVKDILGAVIWALAFAGNKVEWRGQTFRVSRGGRLERI